MPEPNVPSEPIDTVNPDYPELLKFLVEPLLDSPGSLSIDCEQLNNHQQIWLRLAFEGEDKGRVFGRGGRNIQAIRTVLKTAAAGAGKTLHLDIYETQSDRAQRRGNDYERKPRSNRKKLAPRRSPNPDRQSAGHG